MNTANPVQWHANKARELNQEKDKFQRQKNTIAWLRLATVLAGGWLLLKYGATGIVLGLSVAVPALALFLWLLSRSLLLSKKIALLQQKSNLHGEEIEIAGHHFSQRYPGAEFQVLATDYSGDLDIFGNASLFQFLHRSTSDEGHHTLAQWLLSPAGNDLLYARQEAVKELASQPDWSIHFEALGKLQPIRRQTHERLEAWMQQPPGFSASFWRILALVFPVVSLGSLALHLSGFLASPGFYSLVLVFLVLAFSITRRVMVYYRSLDKIVPQLSTLSAALQTLESSSFQSTLLKAAQATLHPAGKLSAGQAIHGLRKILDRFDYRLNPLVFLPLNSFLLWDLQQILALEKWKSQYRDSIAQWFKVLGDVEALNSFALFAFNHPTYSYPQLSEKEGVFRGRQIGHPLIPAEKRVANDFASDGKPSIALITGSNMAGKSTFLRSIGINQVLAMAGSVVCAKELTVSNMRIMSSMRIADNLEENTSTFYAELRKLKAIIEAVNQHLPVFLLLDEILRGTNSHDRQAGSRALLQQLLAQDACGMLATHDLALAGLAPDYPLALQNYHFDAVVDGEELYFDYQLKPGISTSMNASILMKKIGIAL